MFDTRLVRDPIDVYYTTRLFKRALVQELTERVWNLENVSLEFWKDFRSLEIFPAKFVLSHPRPDLTCAVTESVPRPHDEAVHARRNVLYVCTSARTSAARIRSST
jgi:hypothetical protein